MGMGFNMMNTEQKKYEFTGKTMEFEGHTLRRIRYVRDVGGIKKGKIGGWIESEHNLSHEGSCAVFDDAKVFGNGRVLDNSWVCCEAIVKDNAQVRDGAVVHDEAIVGADTIVANNSEIKGESRVFFYADHNYGKPNIYGNSEISGKTTIEATGRIYNSDVENKGLYGCLDIVARLVF